MTKLDNFSNSLRVLHDADRDLAHRDDIYRMGVIGQFNLTFELAWKALKELLLLYGVDTAKTGSPREVLKESYATGFLTDHDIWLDMMIRRNKSVHIYDYSMAIELTDLIFSTYIPAFDRLLDTLLQKHSHLYEKT